MHYYSDFEESDYIRILPSILALFIVLNLPRNGGLRQFKFRARFQGSSSDIH